MRTRRTAILIGCAILLGLFALLADLGHRTDRDSNPKLIGFDPLSVSELEIQTRDGVVRLERQDQGTWLTNGHLAEARFVDEALGSLAELARDDLVARNPERHARLGVDAATSISVRVGVGGAGTQIHIGKEGPARDANFVRLEGDDEVYLSASRLTETFDRGTRGWRDLTLLEARPEDVVRLEIVTDEGTVTAVREDDVWSLLGDTPARANEAAVMSVVHTLSHLSGDQPTDSRDPSITGLSEPSARTALTLSGGERVEILWGALLDGKSYTQRAGAPDVHLLHPWRRSSIVKRYDDLLAP